MVLALDDDWFVKINQALAVLEVEALPQAQSHEVDLVVSDTKSGKVVTRWVVENGFLRSARLVEAGEEPAVLTMPVKAVELLALLSGELDLAVEFMRGDLKPEGPTGIILGLVAALNQPSSRQTLASVL